MSLFTNTDTAAYLKFICRQRSLDSVDYFELNKNVEKDQKKKDIAVDFNFLSIHERDLKKSPTNTGNKNESIMTGVFDDVNEPMKRWNHGTLFFELIEI